jgi:hypothetical protein
MVGVGIFSQPDRVIICQSQTFRLLASQGHDAIGKVIGQAIGLRFGESLSSFTK